MDRYDRYDLVISILGWIAIISFVASVVMAFAAIWITGDELSVKLAWSASVAFFVSVVAGLGYQSL